VGRNACLASASALHSRYPVLVVGTAQAADLRLLSSWDKTNPAVGTLAEAFAKGVEAQTREASNSSSAGRKPFRRFEQLQPATTGVFRCCSRTASTTTARPEMAVGMDAVRGDLEARRKSGLFEAIDKHYQKHGLKLVALPISATRGYHIVLRAPVSANGDLQDGKIRGTPSYHTVINMLGAHPASAGRRGSIPH